MWKSVFICVLFCLVFTLHASTDYDYSDNTLIVVIKPEFSHPTKSVDNAFFGDLDENATIENISLIHNAKAIEALEARYARQKTSPFTQAGGLKARPYDNGYQSIYKITLPTHDKANVLKTIEALNQIPEVDYATPDYIYPFDDVTPNDEYYDTLWGLHGTHGIKAPQAWEITTGSQDIRVGVIDTGIATHPDLDANLTTGYDFYHDNSITTDDETGHGTHVAGTIGAVGNNEIGVVGVNWNVTLVPFQTGEGSAAYSGAIVQAIIYATNTWGTDEQISVLNHSISGYGKNPDDIRLRAISYYPGLFVWSAGNGDMSGMAEDVDFPFIQYFNLPNLIAVGAIQYDGEKPIYSNYSSSGAYVHVYAPGVNIGSTYLNNGYELLEGTSMASPHVSGVAALLLSANPALTASQLKQLIMQGADPHTITVWDIPQTVNRLNAFQAVQLATSLTHISISPVAKDFGHIDINQTSQSQTFTVTALDDVSYTINAITITGESASDFILDVAGLPWTLNMGDTATFTVAFAPMSYGVKTANVNIVSNANEYPLLVSLLGKGWGHSTTIPYTQNFDETTSLDEIFWGSSPNSYPYLYSYWSTPALALRVESSVPSQDVFTPTFIGVTPETTLFFHYQFWSIDVDGLYPTVPSPGDKVLVEVSTTGANGEYTTLYEIRTATTTMPFENPTELSLSAYSGQNVNIRFTAVTPNSRVLIFVLDNVTVSEPDADFDEVIAEPTVTVLAGNYPNPFNPSTSISFSLGVSGFVNIDVYNVRGQRVRSLVSGVYEAGVHNVVWNGVSDDGRSVGSGVYFYRMVSDGYTGVKKMLLLK